MHNTSTKLLTILFGIVHKDTSHEVFWIGGNHALLVTWTLSNTDGSLVLYLLCSVMDHMKILSPRQLDAVSPPSGERRMYAEDIANIC
jgi:hypothetical protein